MRCCTFKSARVWGLFFFLMDHGRSSSDVGDDGGRDSERDRDCDRLHDRGSDRGHERDSDRGSSRDSDRGSACDGDRDSDGNDQKKLLHGVLLFVCCWGLGAVFD